MPLVYKPGDRVRVVRIPAGIAASFPEETRMAFNLALGKTYTVSGANEIGWLEIELGAEIDTALGTTGNTIWIEPECVELAGRRFDRTSPLDGG